MIDIHTHIIPGIDDGAKEIKDTIILLKEAKEAGFDTVITTPHYIAGNYETTPGEVETILEKIKLILQKEKIEVKLCMGNEVYITNNMDEMIQKKEISTLNNSRYLLFELPMNSKILNLDNLIFNLLSINIVPIIAHPERYSYVQKNPNLLLEWIEKGVLFQGNLGSFAGNYGKKAQKTMIKLLKHEMIHFLASDVHRKNTIYLQTNNILGKLAKLIGEEKVNTLMNQNPEKIINDEEIQVTLPTPIKEFKFFKK